MILISFDVQNSQFAAASVLEGATASVNVGIIDRTPDYVV